MPTDLRCVLECDPTDPVIRLVGVLDRHAVHDVRAALLDCLADRAAPVAVDISRVRAAAPGALLRFGEVARTVADWPAGGFVCCAAPPGTGRAWSAAGLTVLPDACRRWGLPRLVDPAAVALTELVNNVVVHSVRRCRCGSVCPPRPDRSRWRRPHCAAGACCWSTRLRGGGAALRCGAANSSGRPSIRRTIHRTETDSGTA
ncbi:hypothetical protein [Micromonospora sp. Llam0]|uniref:STAS domain-containing protein n=1 Tax=Micromonospora sp. Llam0 TaxID=2485143 RepID=UPI001F1EBD36|nr:hypothetical protein [Micromonospora sp. Llam0]